MLTGTRMVTARIVLNLDLTVAPRPCISFKCALVGIWRCWTMTVTMPLPSAAVGCCSSGENLFAMVAVALTTVLVVTVVVLPPPQTTELGLATFVVDCCSLGENLLAAVSLTTVLVVMVCVLPPPQTTDAPWDSVVSVVSFWLAPAKDVTAESISSATPSARPQAALNAGELSGRPSRPLVICDVSLLLFIISFCRWPCEGRDINHDLVPGL